MSTAPLCLATLRVQTWVSARCANCGWILLLFHLHIQLHHRLAVSHTEPLSGILVKCFHWWLILGCYVPIWVGSPSSDAHILLQSIICSFFLNRQQTCFLLLFNVGLQIHAGRQSSPLWFPLRCDHRKIAVNLNPFLRLPFFMQELIAFLTAVLFDYDQV